MRRSVYVRLAAALSLTLVCLAGSTLADVARTRDDPGGRPEHSRRPLFRRDTCPGDPGDGKQCNSTSLQRSLTRTDKDYDSGTYIGNNSMCLKLMKSAFLELIHGSGTQVPNQLDDQHQAKTEQEQSEPLLESPTQVRRLADGNVRHSRLSRLDTTNSRQTDSTRRQRIAIPTGSKRIGMMNSERRAAIENMRRLKRDTSMSRSAERRDSVENHSRDGTRRKPMDAIRRITERSERRFERTQSDGRRSLSTASSLVRSERTTQSDGTNRRVDRRNVNTFEGRKLSPSEIESTRVFARVDRRSDRRSLASNEGWRSSPLESNGNRQYSRVERQIDRRNGDALERRALSPVDASGTRLASRLDRRADRRSLGSNERRTASARTRQSDGIDRQIDRRNVDASVGRVLSNVDAEGITMILSADRRNVRRSLASNERNRAFPLQSTWRRVSPVDTASSRIFVASEGRRLKRENSELNIVERRVSYRISTLGHNRLARQDRSLNRESDKMQRVSIQESRNERRKTSLSGAGEARTYESRRNTPATERSRISVERTRSPVETQADFVTGSNKRTVTNADSTRQIREYTRHTSTGDYLGYRRMLTRKMSLEISRNDARRAVIRMSPTRSTVSTRAEYSNGRRELSELSRSREDRSDIRYSATQSTRRRELSSLNVDIDGNSRRTITRETFYRRMSKPLTQTNRREMDVDRSQESRKTRRMLTASMASLVRNNKENLQRVSVKSLQSRTTDREANEERRVLTRMVRSPLSRLSTNAGQADDRRKVDSSDDIRRTLTMARRVDGHLISESTGRRRVKRETAPETSASARSRQISLPTRKQDRWALEQAISRRFASEDRRRSTEAIAVRRHIQRNADSEDRTLSIITRMASVRRARSSNARTYTRSYEFEDESRYAAGITARRNSDKTEESRRRSPDQRRSTDVSRMQRERREEYRSVTSTVLRRAVSESMAPGRRAVHRRISESAERSARRTGISSIVAEREGRERALTRRSVEPSTPHLGVSRERVLAAQRCSGERCEAQDRRSSNKVRRQVSEGKENERLSRVAVNANGNIQVSRHSRAHTHELSRKISTDGRYWTSRSIYSEYSSRRSVSVTRSEIMDGNEGRRLELARRMSNILSVADSRNRRSSSTSERSLLRNTRRTEMRDDGKVNSRLAAERREKGTVAIVADSGKRVGEDLASRRRSDTNVLTSRLERRKETGVRRGAVRFTREQMSSGHSEERRYAATRIASTSSRSRLLSAVSRQAEKSEGLLDRNYRRETSRSDRRARANTRTVDTRRNRFVDTLSEADQRRSRSETSQRRANSYTLWSAEDSTRRSRNSDVLGMDASAAFARDTKTENQLAVSSLVRPTFKVNDVPDSYVSYIVGAILICATIFYDSLLHSSAEGSLLNWFGSNLSKDQAQLSANNGAYDTDFLVPNFQLSGKRGQPGSVSSLLLGVATGAAASLRLI